MAILARWLWWFMIRFAIIGTMKLVWESRSDLRDWKQTAFKLENLVCDFLFEISIVRLNDSDDSDCFRSISKAKQFARSSFDPIRNQNCIDWTFPYWNSLRFFHSDWDSNWFRKKLLSGITNHLVLLEVNLIKI